MKRTLTVAGLAFIGFCGFGPAAQAAFIVDLQEVGPNVVATGSGTLGLTGLTFFAIEFPLVWIDPSVAAVYTGIAPTSFESGTDSATWDNQTFSTLGVTPGTYVWTWGSVPDDSERFTLNIGLTTPVPEPASLTLLATGLLAFGWLGRRRRRESQARPTWTVKN